MNIDLIYRVEAGLALAGLWLLIWEYREFRIDELRQRLFAIRDQLFREASRGKIAFESSAYGVARTTLNGMIRFAHEVSAVRILLSLALIRRANPEFVGSFKAKLASSVRELPNDEARSAINGAVAMMDLSIIRHLVLTSPIVFAHLSFAVVRHLLKRSTDGVSRSVHTSFAVQARTSGSKRVVRQLEAEAHSVSAGLAARVC